MNIRSVTIEFSGNAITDLLEAFVENVILLQAIPRAFGERTGFLPNPLRTVWKLADAGPIRIDAEAESPGAATVRGRFDKPRKAVYAHLTSPRQVARANQLDEELFGPSEFPRMTMEYAYARVIAHQLHLQKRRVFRDLVTGVESFVDPDSPTSFMSRGDDKVFL